VGRDLEATIIIMVRQVLTCSVNGQVFQHRVVSGKYVDVQTSLAGPRIRVWTHLAVLRRGIPERLERRDV
jgi:hypothetical protein